MINEFWFSSVELRTLHTLGACYVSPTNKSFTKKFVEKKFSEKDQYPLLEVLEESGLNIADRLWLGTRLVSPVLMAQSLLFHHQNRILALLETENKSRQHGAIEQIRSLLYGYRQLPSTPSDYNWLKQNNLRNNVFFVMSALCSKVAKDYSEGRVLEHSLSKGLVDQATLILEDIYKIFYAIRPEVCPWILSYPVTPDFLADFIKVIKSAEEAAFLVDFHLVTGIEHLVSLHARSFKKTLVPWKLEQE